MAFEIPKSFGSPQINSTNMRCLFCNSEKKITAKFCSNCGKDWKDFESGIDSFSSLQKYNLFCKDLVANSSELSAIGANDAIRERLKISFGASEKILSKIINKYSETSHLSHFLIELIYDSSQSFATHDTYLKFLFTNKSASEGYRVSISWADTECEPNVDFRAISRSIIRPGEVGIFGGTHVFPRAGTKEISEMRLFITNILDEEALFLVEPFQLKVGSADTKIFNTINTTTQISVTGRNVVDASGIAKNIGTTPQSSNAELSIPLRAIFSPLEDCIESENAFLKGLAAQQLIDGNEYRGEWVDGKYSGHGELKFSDQRKYIGTFSNGEMDGFGTLTYPNGDSYCGNFSQGKYFGNGKLTLIDGTIYEGAFKSGLFPDSGVVAFPDGSAYQGSFLEGKFHGEGKFKDSNGVISSGNWINGKLVFPEEFSSFRNAVQGLNLANIFGSNKYLESNSPTTLGLGLGSDGAYLIKDLNELGNICLLSDISREASLRRGGEAANLFRLCALNVLFKAKPDQVRLLLIDGSSSVGISIFQDFEKIGNLLCPPTIGAGKAANALNWVVNEASRRKKLFSKFGIDSLSAFNAKCSEAEQMGSPLLNPFSLTPDDPERLFLVPNIYILINGLDDLVFVNSGILDYIKNICNGLSRYGLHLIVNIKSDSLLHQYFESKIIFRSRFPLATPSLIPSDWPSLLSGHGDAFYSHNAQDSYVYFQTPVIGVDELNRVVNWARSKYDCHYIDGVFGESNVDDDGEDDPLYQEAVNIVMTNNSPSISLVQRSLRIGFNRSARLLGDMERAGLVSSMSSDGKRTILRRI